MMDGETYEAEQARKTKDKIEWLKQRDLLQEQLKLSHEKERGRSGSDPGRCFAAGLLAVLLVVGGSVIYRMREDKFPEKNVPLSEELKPYDLNKDGRLDSSELE